MSDVLQLLHDPCSYDDDCENYGVFNISSKLFKKITHLLEYIVPDAIENNDECIEVQDEPSENVEEQENLTLKEKLYKIIEKKTVLVPSYPINNKQDK